MFLKRVDHGQGERKTANFSCLNLVLLYFVDTDTKLDICVDFKHNLTVYKIYDWDSRPRPHDAPQISYKDSIKGKSRARVETPSQNCTVYSGLDLY